MEENTPAEKPIPKNINLEFLQKVQRATDLEPKMTPAETAAEYVMRTNKEKVDALTKRQVQGPASQTPPPQAPTAPREVVFYKGYKLSRDLFTLLTLCIITMKDKKIKELIETFGFELKDLDGKVINLQAKKKNKKIKKRK